MKKLQAGEKVNTSENRAALHTALRQKKGAPSPIEAVQRAWAELDRLDDFLPTLDNYTDIVQVGIGGSSLGPEAIYEALKAYAIPGRRAHFISNIDPDEITDVLKCVSLSKTLFVIVSKSGTTMETVTNEAFVQAELLKAGLDPTMHLIAVTGKGSPMDIPEKYRAIFYIWDYIGGRYSTTSMVGGVLLAFTLGFETFLQFLDGAHAMDQVALRENPRDNLPLLGAMIGVWNRSFLGLPTVAVIPYSQALSRFPAHLQQLEMESNGKRVDKQGRAVEYMTGPIVWGEPGTSSQHSFFQEIHQGTTIIPIEFIGFQESQYGHDLLLNGSTSQEKLNGNMLAQALALALGQSNKNPNQEFPGNRPSQLLIGKKCDAPTVGALLAYYEHKVAFQGFLWNINSFDQEGVQLGKKLATQMIDALAKSRKGEKVTDLLQEAMTKLI
ncbi:MAG: glucose-6-phosphate isomerase, partial [Rhabdochlamydiaceae bacterium]